MGRCPLQVSKLPAGAYSLWPLVFYVEEPVHIQQDCQEYELAGSCKSCTKLRVQEDKSEDVEAEGSPRAEFADRILL